MVVGYARAHSRDRDLRLQRAALKRAGCDVIVEVPESDVSHHRDGLKQAVTILDQGGHLVVRKLDRLASSLKQWMAISALLQERGIMLRVLEDGQDANGVAETVVGRLLSALAEYEQIRHSAHAPASAAASPQLKRRRGRPPGTDEAKRAAALALRRESACSITEICQRVGISRPTFYRYCRTQNSNSISDPLADPTEPMAHSPRACSR